MRTMARVLKTQNTCHEGQNKIIFSVIASMVDDIECQTCSIMRWLMLRVRHAVIWKFTKEMRTLLDLSIKTMRTFMNLSLPI